MSRAGAGRHRLLIVIVLLGLTTSGCAPSELQEGAVVLVHGLGRTSRSLIVLERRLERAGFRVVSYDYPSTTESFERLVDSLGVVVESCCVPANAPVHFVTHSMGGVLVRALLRDSVPPYVGRVVMLSPPNQGSEIVDAFSPSPLLVSVLGPAGAALGTDSSSVPQRLGPARFPLGIIAGNRSMTRLGSRLIPGPDDGLVGVEQTRLEGADDFLVVPATHTTIMNRRDVAGAVVRFLASGRFSEASPSDR